MKKYDPCPCGSKLLYHKCCKPIHEGAPPQDALALMRSRYSAYVLGLCDYIIETTHPENVVRRTDIDAWKKEINQFCKTTRFVSLDVLEVVDGEDQSVVAFRANMFYNEKDVSFTERSTFEKLNGRWLYKSGEVEP